MQKQYLFMLALGAIKPDERFKESREESGKIIFISDGGPEYGYNMETEVGLTPVNVVAPTVKIAEKMGLDIAREKFPLDEGWRSHSVMIRLMEKKKIKEVLPLIGWGEPLVDDDDSAMDEEPIIISESLS
jgi:hypothetical protein